MLSCIANGMKLTDHEKRDIIKLIEMDKPLPDKYRFLLFDDKREVELVWNGKKPARRPIPRWISV